jgi:hypothetical protein
MCRKCSEKLADFKNFKTTCHLSIQIFQNSLLIKVKEEDSSSEEFVQDADYEEESLSGEYGPEEQPIRKSKRTKTEDDVKPENPTDSPYLYFCVEKDCAKRFKKLKPYEAHCLKHAETAKNENVQTNTDKKPRKAVIRAHPCTYKGCDKTFKHSIVRDSHVLTHENGGIVSGNFLVIKSHVLCWPFPQICCPICLRYQFKKYHHMLKHLTVHQSKEQRKDSFVCPICQRTSISKASFFEHALTHKGQQHVCDECGKVCTTSLRLRVCLVIWPSQQFAYPDFRCSLCLMSILGPQAVP